MIPDCSLDCLGMRNPKDPEREGATLRTLRETRGWKPDPFANAAGISRSYLANIEAGRKPMSNVLLAKFADLLDVSQIAIMRPRPTATDDEKASA